MAAPKAQPIGMINVTSTAQLQGKLELFGFGFHEAVINPGDLLIVCTDYVGENFHKQEVEFKLRLRGRDMHLFAEAAKTALFLWKDNEHWLNAPANGPRVDTRSLSEIRLAENLHNINALLGKAI